MRVSLNTWSVGEPPSLTIEAETPDDTIILGAMTAQHGRKIMIAGHSWGCSPPASGKLAGCFEMFLGWAK